MGYELHDGDCLDVMRAMDANSVDTVVCDPPYGLSEGVSAQGMSNRIYNALVKIGFPNLHERNAKFVKGGNLAGITRGGSDLSSVNGSIGVKAGIGVPECAVDLHCDCAADQEVHNGDVTPILGVADWVLANEVDAQRGQFMGDFILDLGDLDSIGLTGELPDSCLAQAFNSGFSVPIFASLAPCLPCGDSGSVSVVIANEDIGGCDCAPRESLSAPCVMTLPRTVNALMLRFDMRGRPIELVATHRASHLATIGEFGGAQLVRAFPAASGLASVAEAHRVRFISLAADGTHAIYWFHLWVPLGVDVKGIIPRGGFMGKDWDSTLPNPQVWSEALRVAKPGAMLLAFGGTRTHHRLMVAIEDAGWEIRDVIMWVYGSGFPKSHDISKGIDKAAGATREVLSSKWRGSRAGISAGIMGKPVPRTDSITAPATSLARDWQGWGTALKPAWEPIIVAMKPLDGTFAQNAARHGVAGLNIDGSRIGTESIVTHGGGGQSGSTLGWSGNDGRKEPTTRVAINEAHTGRWPANLILDEEAARLLDEQSGVSKSTRADRGKGIDGATFRNVNGELNGIRGHDDTGGASRFFYCAKASRREREAGLEDVKTHGTQGARPGSPDPSGKFPDHDHRERGGNNHPTVKPLSLMRYLVRLTSTPTGGVVLDPFMGSGTTGIAALQEGRKFIGIELDADYYAIAEKRIANAAAQPPLIPHESEPKHEQEALWP